MEPNTGVMLVRATPQGIAMYQHWLKRIVKTNVMNDQIVFDRDSRLLQIDVEDNGKLVYAETNFTSTFTANCNWDYSNPTPTTRVTPSDQHPHLRYLPPLNPLHTPFPPL